jgi:uncharacterized protein (TIGR03083 family)
MKIPIDLVNMLPRLDKLLLDLLHSLSPADWNKQTVARQWKVKDVVAHLLDGNVRILSMLRDNYYGEKADVQSNEELIGYLNRLNADWVQAMKRVSPSMLISLHEFTGPLYCHYYQSLDPFGTSPFAVNWAGESESRNWMHIAREYTEKWLHQQQIRDATGQNGLMTREYFYPFINVFMLALPYTFRSREAAEGTIVKVTVAGDIGGSWYLYRSKDNWKLDRPPGDSFAAAVTLDADTAWKLFSKSLRPADVKDKVHISGDRILGETVLTMVSVMA